MSKDAEEIKDIEINISIKVNGKEIELTDDEISSLLEQILETNVSYSIKPVFMTVYDS